jgi:hypothetical protein
VWQYQMNVYIFRALHPCHIVDAIKN